jgi:hypothetical protein
MKCVNAKYEMHKYKMCKCKRANAKCEKTISKDNKQR